jgi:hypothetical protein
MAKTITSEKITLKRVRLSFPALDRPKPFEPPSERNPNPAKRWSLTGLLDPSDASHAASIEEIKAKARQICTEYFGAGKIPVIPKAKLCWSEAKDREKDYAGWEGMTTIKASSAEDKPPRIIDMGKKDLKPGDKQFPYAGCYVNLLITLWVQDNSYGKRVNANLLAVQFAGDGDSFGAPKVDIDSAFEVLEETAAAASSSDPW